MVIVLARASKDQGSRAGQGSRVERAAYFYRYPSDPFSYVLVTYSLYIQYYFLRDIHLPYYPKRCFIYMNQRLSEG